MRILDPAVAGYLEKLATHEYRVLNEIEKIAEKESFPIIGPEAGRLIYVLVKASRPKVVFELGSGYGYSALWAAMALEDGAKVHLTEDQAELVSSSKKYFEKAGLLSKAIFHQMDALEAYRKFGGAATFVLVDLFKPLYPEAFKAIKEMLPVGGLVLADNLLWSGRVVSRKLDDTACAIVEFTKKLWSDRDFVPAFLPVRDGVGVAIRVSKKG
jgi:caffeoyl-CoA O-methyltransferase